MRTRLRRRTLGHVRLVTLLSLASGTACATAPVAPADGTTSPDQTPSTRGLSRIPAAYRDSSFYGRSIAVVIGIDAYRELPPLGGAARDARRVGTALEGQGFRVTQLLDGEATRERIRDTLGREVLDVVDENSRVLVYFAGHGATIGAADEQLGYLMPSDAVEAQIAATGISMEEMQRWFGVYRSKHVMLVADACYSGLALPQSRGTGLSPTAQDYMQVITSERARASLVAGTDEQVAHEIDGVGVFTDFVLSGIAGSADANKDGLVTSHELAAYVAPAVAKSVRERFGAVQTPQSGHVGRGEFVFFPAAGSDPGPCATGRDCFSEAKKAVERGDVDSALRHLDQACEHQHGMACWRLGELSAHDPPKARTLLRQACDLGFAEGCTELGRRYRDQDLAYRFAGLPDEGSYDDALQVFGKACDAGDPGGCSGLSEMLGNGKGAAPDPNRAVALLRRGCALGADHRSARVALLAGAACEELGQAYDNSLYGLSYSFERAMEFWTQAAAHYRAACESKEPPDAFTTDPDARGEACFGLSLLVRSGMGVAQDDGERTRLAKLACTLDYGGPCDEEADAKRSAIATKAMDQYERGQLDAAARALRGIVRADITGVFHDNLAFVLFDQGHARLALREWNTARLLAGSSSENKALMADIMAGRAVALAALGSAAEAFASYDAAVEWDATYLDCEKLRKAASWSNNACAVHRQLVELFTRTHRDACERGKQDSCALLTKVGKQSASSAGR